MNVNTQYNKNHNSLHEYGIEHNNVEFFYYLFIFLFTLMRFISMEHHPTRLWKERRHKKKVVFIGNHNHIIMHTQKLLIACESKDRPRDTKTQKKAKLFVVSFHVECVLMLRGAVTTEEEKKNSHKRLVYYKLSEYIIVSRSVTIVCNANPFFKQSFLRNYFIFVKFVIRQGKRNRKK